MERANILLCLDCGRGLTVLLLCLLMAMIMVKRWNNIDLSEDKELLGLTKRTPLNTVYRYYGTGDTGGSPSIGSVSSVEKGIKGNGPLEIISATSDQLFKDYLPYEKHSELPVFNGELLMDVHGTGCYTFRKLP